MFIERPLPKVKIGRPRALVYGIGINDAPYSIAYVDERGKEHRCPFYSRWRSLLQRVADPKFQEKYPHYKSCTIDPDWLRFTTFRVWMEKQDWEGKDLDKDLRYQGNKHYGPDTCLFIRQELNKLLCLRQNDRGSLPLGVTTTTIRGKKYITAFCSFYAKSKNLGYFDSVGEAAEAYKKAKLAYIKELADLESNPLIKEALLRLF